MIKTTHDQNRTQEIPSELNSESVRRLLAWGYSQAQIARIYNCTRQYINKLSPDEPVKKSARDEVLKHYPWNLAEHRNVWHELPFHRAYLDKLMRDHAEFLWIGDQFEMSLDKRKRLVSFYKKLKTEALVVEFSPEIPPTEHNSVGGFRYVPRIESDGWLIVRRNEYTTITEEGEALWTLPAEWPITE